MGLQRWNTTEYVDVVLTSETVVSIVKEMANMLADHTSGTLTETIDTSTEYEGLVDYGDVVYRLYAKKSSATAVSVQIRAGYMNGSTFVSVGGTVSDTVTVNTNIISASNVAVLFLVDGGEYFELQYRLGSVAFKNMALHAIRFTSSLDSTSKRRFSYIANLGSGSDPYKMDGFGASGYFYINGSGTQLSLSATAISQNNLKNTVPLPRIMLYPGLYYIATSGYEMGVPTLGGKRIYSSGANVPAGTAYYVGTTQYLCAGSYLHIVNT